MDPDRIQSIYTLVLSEDLQLLYDIAQIRHDWWFQFGSPGGHQGLWGEDRKGVKVEAVNVGIASCHDADTFPDVFSWLSSLGTDRAEIENRNAQRIAKPTVE